MTSQISPDGEYIDIESSARSEDAAGSPITSLENLVAERITYENGKQAFKIGVEPSYGEGAGMYLSFEDAAALRDWLIGLDL